jgi:hypothetical protein
MPYTPAMAGLSQSSGPYTALAGLTTPTVGTAGGGFGQENVVTTLFDRNPFAIMQDIHYRHAPVSDFRLFLKAFGMGRGVDAPTTGHYETDWDRGLVKLTTINTAPGGVGQNMVATLHSDSMYNAGATIGGTATWSSEVQPGDILMSPTGRKQAIVTVKDITTAPTAHRITLRPLDPAVNIDAAFVVNGSYAVVGNAFGEGTGLPLGRIRRVTKYTNKFQIIKTGGGVTGSEMSNSLFVRFKPTEDGNSIFGEMNDLAWADYERQSALVLLNGQPITNVTATINEVNTDATVNGTEGMLEWVTTNGHTHIIVPATYALADFDNISRTLFHERAGNVVVLCLDGFDIYAASENLLLGQSGTDLTSKFVQDAMVNYSGMEAVWPDDMQPFLDSDFSFYVGFKALHKSGVTYIFKILHEFCDVNGLAAATYNGVYSNSRLVLPMGEIKDQRSGKKGFMAGYEWKQKGNYSRETILSDFAGAGAQGSANGVSRMAVDQYDRVRFGIVSEIAFHGACPNKAVWQHPAF